METKICTKCGKELPATIEYFYKDTTVKSGLHASCKTCKSERSEKAYLKNKEKILKQQAKYKQEHKKQISEYGKKYHQEHKEQIAERLRKYYQNNKYKPINKQKKAIYAKKLMNTLHPAYIANKLHISVKDLTSELLEQKRLTILIKRELLWQKEI
jgi:hypothetical protein